MDVIQNYDIIYGVIQIHHKTLLSCKFKQSVAQIFLNKINRVYKGKA